MDLRCRVGTISDITNFGLLAHNTTANLEGRCETDFNDKRQCLQVSSRKAPFYSSLLKLCVGKRLCTVTDLMKIFHASSKTARMGEDTCG